MADPDGPPQLVALFGPTGLGKTEIAIELAMLLGAEIVSADSMQVYGGLPVLTNQPTPEQRAQVPHHLVGVVEPHEDFSVADYARLAHAAIDAVLARGRLVVLEGGSGLYMRAGLGGLTFGAPPSPALRAELEALAQSDPDELARRLKGADPATFAETDTANPRRVVRTLETVLVQGRPLSELQRRRLWSDEGTRYRYRLFGLDVDRERLRERVEARVDEMVAHGLADEVAALPQPLSRTVSQAIGVREMRAVQAGELTLAQATARMKARTRGYVRRQLTWMRKLNADIIPWSVRPPAAIAQDVRRRLVLP